MIELLQVYFIFENKPSFSLQDKEKESVYWTRTLCLFCDIFVDHV